jgi:hypothetical protein
VTGHSRVTDRDNQTKAFRTSELHRNLLQYLTEKSLSGTADGLNEYTVGLDVFAKPASYDPRQESVVRMHVARLRHKLAEYYRTEGADVPVIVDIPKGAFEVTFAPREVPIEQFSAWLKKRPLMICLTASNGSTGAGTARGAFVLGQFLANRKNNVLESNGIRNLSPSSGEPAFVPDQPPSSSKGSEKTLALVSHVPGLYGKAAFCICRRIKFRAL